MSGTAKSDDVIWTMPTRFVAAGHAIDPVLFASTMLLRQRAEMERALASGAILPVTELERLSLDRLPDLTARAPRSRGAAAYVNAGRWIAKCECGGAEYVDPAMPVFFCCSCWNRADGHRWRGVRLPAEPGRSAIEDVLLARPAEVNRNWRPGERVRDLERENTQHGLPPRRGRAA